jgi:hypothetical protein
MLAVSACAMPLTASNRTVEASESLRRLLDIARKLYKALVAQYPDRLITTAMVGCWQAANGGLNRMLQKMPHSGVPGPIIKLAELLLP